MPQLGILLDDVDWYEMRHSGEVKEFQFGNQSLVILYRPNRMVSEVEIQKKRDRHHPPKRPPDVGRYECSECHAVLKSKPSIGIHVRYHHPGKKDIHIVSIPLPPPKKEK